MEIKNFLGNFPGSSGKIKIAIFGVFVLAGAVFFAFCRILAGVILPMPVYLVMKMKRYLKLVHAE